MIALHAPYPLFGQSPDNQDHCFKCKILTEKFEMKGVNIIDIYTNNITVETAEVLTNI